MAEITVEIVGDKLAVSSPYNAKFPAKARKLGGKWTGGRWVFPAHVGERVRELCRTIYGSDGDVEAPRVLVRVALDEGHDYDCSLTLAGIPVARVFDRDGGAKIDDGAAVLEGGITSGGSRKNPLIEWVGGTVVQLEIPETSLDAVRAEGHVATVELVDTGTEGRRAQLEAEAERLRARLVELEAELARI